ncbi:MULTISPECIES: hypothetical protein [unclassified Leptolyngbya]|uniref:hypothetical protein n=1 Tax=unclassified Leptolyngbya TaxID=2650499 RepID=UPI003D319504
MYPHLPYALDNGKYIRDERDEVWDRDLFIDHCDQILHLPKSPLWLTVPDKRRDAIETLELWREWEPKLRKYQVPLAFVLQDGINLNDIPETADVLFVGGSDNWRYPRLKELVAVAGKRPLHVGRVNGNRVWQCHRAGVSSVDGSGWFRGDKQQLEKLERYVRAQIGEAQVPHHDQLDLFSGQHEYLSYFSIYRPHLSAEALIEKTKDPTPLTKQRRIPDNIESDHLIQAMSHWRSFGPVPFRQRPQKYAVFWNNDLFPVKLLIARSNVYANGILLNTSRFCGGIEEANRFVERRGLQIVHLKAQIAA